MEGYSGYFDNIYITGTIKWLEDNVDLFKGKDGYSVSLSAYDATIAVNADGAINDALYDIINIINGSESVYTDTE